GAARIRAETADYRRLRRLTWRRSSRIRRTPAATRTDSNGSRAAHPGILEKTSGRSNERAGAATELGNHDCAIDGWPHHHGRRAGEVQRGRFRYFHRGGE